MLKNSFNKVKAYLNSYSMQCLSYTEIKNADNQTLCHINIKMRSTTIGVYQLY